MPKGIYERKIGLKRRLATEETKKKMSISHIGQYVSLKTRKKLSESHKGKKPYIMTQKIKDNISKSKRGSIPWNKNKPQLQTTGNKHPRWKGGVSKHYKEGYSSFEYKQWRAKIFLRDNFTCQFCGIRKVYLTAHHIKSWAKYPKLRFDIKNGITLCENCHKLTDNYKGRNNNKIPR